MWFKFPAGVSEVSVEQQTFRAELKDDEGKDIFRAPNHFAQKLAMIGIAPATPPADAPADLPLTDPSKDASFATMAAELENLKSENKTLRENNAINTSLLRAKTTTITMLEEEVSQLKVKVASLEEELEDRPLVTTTSTTSKKAA